MKKLLLVVNPVAGKGLGKLRLFSVADELTRHGYRVTVLPTSPNGDTEDIIAKEAKDYSTITAIGGDGTLNAVANGIMRSERDTPMGYIPLGSTNDFAASLGLTKNIRQACERIAENEPRAVDIGRFGDKYFVYVACTGLFAGVSYMTSQQMKNFFGHSAYLIKGLFELSENQKAKYTIELENETIGGDFLYAGVSNTLKLGGIFSLPKGEISFDDGYFELTLIKAPKNIIDGTALTNELINSRFDSHNFMRRKIRKAVIRCNTARGWSIDGENGGEKSEAVIEVKEKSLRLIY